MLRFEKAVRLPFSRGGTRAGLLSQAFMLTDCLKLQRPAAPVAERCSTGASLAMKRSGILQGCGVLAIQKSEHSERCFRVFTPAEGKKQLSLVLTIYDRCPPIIVQST